MPGPLSFAESLGTCVAFHLRWLLHQHKHAFRDAFRFLHSYCSLPVLNVSSCLYPGVPVSTRIDVRVRHLSVNESYARATQDLLVGPGEAISALCWRFLFRKQLHRFFRRPRAPKALVMMSCRSMTFRPPLFTLALIVRHFHPGARQNIFRSFGWLLMMMRT